MTFFGRHQRGSMMIWVVLLGMMLTSVFFFFGTRLQGKLLAYQNFNLRQTRQAYLESYANYLKQLEAAELADLAADNDDAVDFDDFTGTLTQNVSTLEGFLEMGDQESYADLLDGSLTLEWNRCETEADDESADVILYGNTPHYHTGSCSGNDVVADAVSFNHLGVGQALTIQALNGPTHYRFTRNDGAPLKDVKWHLTLSLPTQFGKTLEWEESF